MIIFSGPTGSGKTSKLLQIYLNKGEKERTDDCLVLVKNAAGVSDWRSRVELSTMGSLNVFTYFGFAQREVAAYWPWIEEKLPGGMQTVEPIFMNVETAHYLMSNYVKKDREHSGVYDYISATPAQLAVQLIDNLNQAAMNCLSFKEMGDRLLRWAGEERERILLFNQVLAIMQKFRTFCLANRILDYSLLVELFNQYLLPAEQYRTALAQRYRFLLVDNLEKTVPAAQQLLRQIARGNEETYFTFNPEEGINRFFGGNPELARNIFFRLCSVEKLTAAYTSSAEARQLAGAIKQKVFADGELKETPFIKGQLDAELRGEMLLKTGAKVVSLLEEGVSPGEIALLAPLIDKVMEFSLERYLKERGYSLVNLARSKRLVDIPFAQALITLTLLSHPDWGTVITYSALQQTLSLLLKLDPVRSARLAEEIFKNALVLPELDEQGLRAKIGFHQAEKYQYLKSWLREKQQQKLELQHFFQLVFGELLAPLAPLEEDILACRQMIDALTRFEQVVSKDPEIKGEELGRHFIDLIYNGTLAADVLFRHQGDQEQVLLTTPYQFLFSPRIDRVSYLIWLDISSESWFQSIAKELSNPYILSASWEEKKEWNDQIDQSLRCQQLVDYLQSILRKATAGLYLADSYLSSRGWEQDGQLYQWLQPDRTGGEA